MNRFWVAAREGKCYPVLDAAHFIGSLLVILIHCGKLTDDEWLHFGVKNILCRLAVPMFLMSNGYFFKMNGYNKIGEWLYPRLRQYLFWSFLYLPYGWWFLSQEEIPLDLYPIALIGALFYLGTCYHLWYFPALFTGTWLAVQLRKIGYGGGIFVALVLYGFGSLETYAGYFRSGWMFDLYSVFQAVFYTTRNGFFYALLFILLGFVLAEYQAYPVFQNWLWLKFSFSFLFLLIEGWLIFHRKGMDYNFYFSLPLVVFFMVALLVKYKEYPKKRIAFRKYSQKIFFYHPFFLETIKVFFLLEGFVLFTGTVLSLMILFGMIGFLKKSREYSKKKGSFK